MFARAALSSIVLFAIACDGCEEGAPEPEAPAVATERRPAPEPEGFTFEAALLGGAQTLSEARRYVGRHPARLLMPRTPGELVERMVDAESGHEGGADIGLAERIADDATLWSVGVEEGWVVAVRVSVDEDPAAPLGPGIPLHPGAPEGASWVGAAPDDDQDEAAALAGDVLILGERAAAVRRALPYAAFTLATAEPPDGAPARGARARLAESLPADLRRTLDGLVEAAVAEELGRIREERARHEDAPDFGEPEAVIAHGARFVRAWLAYLPDLGETEVELALSDGPATLTLRAEVRAGSPLAERLEATPRGGARELEALPDDTAFAVSMRSAPDGASTFSFLEAFGDVAGDRLSAGDRAAIDALGAAWDAARGPEVVVAAGGGAEDAWLVTALPAPRAELTEVAIARVVGSRFSASILGSLFDCPRAARPRFGAPLCAGAPALSFGRSDARTVFGLGRRSAAANAIAEAEGARLGALPDAERALSALGEELIAAAIVFPSRIALLGGLSGSEPLQRLSRVSALAARPAPIAVGMSASGGELVVRIVATEPAIEDAMNLVEAF